MNPQKTLSDTPNPKYVPPKGWKELNTDEKIERMRETIKSIANVAHRADNQFHSLRRLLANHEHRADGKVMQALKEYDDSVSNLVATANSLETDNPYF